MKQHYVLATLALLLLGSHLPGLGQGFATTPAPWAVPVGGYTALGFNALIGNNGQLPGSEGWNVTDLTGDGVPDLVVTRQGAGIQTPVLGGLTAPYWRVHPGTATGFGAPVTWPVPMGGHSQYGFNGSDAWDSATAGNQNWACVDLNADQRPDLVVMSIGDGTDFNVLGTVQAPYWRVYLNTGAGFSPTPTTWPVPVGGSPTAGFNDLRRSGSNVIGYQGWETLDLTGDGLLDLVVTYERISTGPMVLGGLTAPRWRVYPGTRTGFSLTGLDWPVPVGGNHLTGFSGISGTGSPQSNSQNWLTQDMNADGRPDLVITGQGNGSTTPVLGGVANPYWLVALNNGRGFDTMVFQIWRVPVGGSAFQGFNWPDGGSATGNGASWRTLDLTGDAIPDLIVAKLWVNGASQVPGGPAAPYWQVYPGTATGFGAQLTWTVPVGGSPTDGFLYPTGVGGRQVGYQSWTTMNMDADQRPDLLVMAESDGSQNVVLGGPTTPTWHVFRNLGTVLATAPPAPAARLTAWPNPCQRMLTLTTDLALHGQPYTLLDQLGRPVATGTIAQPTQPLDLGALPAGLYLLRVGGQGQGLKVVKQ